jgi:pimeloyl-ACP methyl ester carboxylesterase
MAQQPGAGTVMAMDAERWQSSGTVFQFRGHRVFYCAAGEGPVLLCIHGFPVSSWDWHRVWPELSRHFRVVAPDLLGYGFSAKPLDHRYSTFEQADLIEALLRHLGISRCHVLAHDYGDTVAQELLARVWSGTSSAVFDSVCLLNGGLFPETHRALPVQRLLLSPLGPLIGRLFNRSALARSMRSLFGARSQPDAADLDAQWQLVASGDGRRIIHKLIRYIVERRENRERWVNALIDSKIPLRLVVGADDPVSGRHMAQRCRELIADADIIVLDGIGHWPQLEAPAAVTDAVLEFILGHTATGAVRGHEKNGRKSSAR